VENSEKMGIPYRVMAGPPQGSGAVRRPGKAGFALAPAGPERGAGEG